LKAEHPSTSFQLAMDKLDMHAALALGFPYEFLFSAAESGGAPSRFAFETASKEITRLRNNVYRPKLNIISYVSIMDAVERGIFPPMVARNPVTGRYQNILTRGNWNFGTLPSADAFRDDKSDIMSIRAGTKTRDDVTTANSGIPFPNVLRRTKQEAVMIAKSVQDANRELKTAGYDPTVTINEIAQAFDNPQQAAVGNDLEQKSSAPTKTDKAALAAFMGDVNVGDLPEATRSEIKRILGTNGHTDVLRVVKYGMVAPELERMADPENLETAQRNLRYCTNGNCADEVHANSEKHVIVNNGRVVDGHHFLAKALKGKVTKSLHVIDLTPTRFQQT
jgi:hypothetical protein